MSSSCLFAQVSGVQTILGPNAMRPPAINACLPKRLADHCAARVGVKFAREFWRRSAYCDAGDLPWPDDDAAP
jgi:hypothetical protein